MRKQGWWLRVLGILLIGFLAVYSGCLIWSGMSKGQITWAEELRAYVIQSCMKISTPHLTSADEPEKSWKVQAWGLLADVLNWPFVIVEETPAISEYSVSTGEVAELSGNENNLESEMHSETKRQENGAGTGREGEGNADSFINTGTKEHVENTLEAETSEQMENGLEADSLTPVSAGVTLSLLPVEGQVRPEIRALPPINQLGYDQFFDYSYLLKKMYVVNTGCSVNEEILDPKRLLAKNLTISHKGEDYQILIYHTHSQESFADSMPGEISHTVVGLGNYLTQLLEEKGYRVLHDTGIYDMENGVLERDYAYDRALPMLEQTLSQHPEIQVVIDLHRDGVAEDVHLVTDVNGVPTARLMFFNGMCRNESGERADVSNPYREDCLAFSLQSALQLEAYYPGMLRVIYLKQNRYNQHLRSRSMLAEVGAQTNTVEEAYNAIPVLADILARVLQ